MIISEEKIEMREANIYIKKIGEGIPIVFLHGGPGGEHRFFLPHMEKLADTFQLVFYDQTGCGQSDPAPDGQYSMKDEVGKLELLRKKLGMEKINLFGESWGSMLALMYAAAYPKKVGKLLLTAAVGATVEGFQRFGDELNRRLSDHDKAKLTELERDYKSGKAALEDIFSILNPYYVYSAEALTRKQKTVSNHEVNEILGRDINANYDLREQLESLSHIPITIAQGSHDVLTPQDIQELLINYIPHARLIEIENCGHWTVIEKPNIMIEIACEFF